MKYRRNREITTTLKQKIARRTSDSEKEKEKEMKKGWIERGHKQTRLDCNWIK
jgi:hypothetical protein